MRRKFGPAGLATAALVGAVVTLLVLRPWDAGSSNSSLAAGRGIAQAVRSTTSAWPSAIPSSSASSAPREKLSACELANEIYVAGAPVAIYPQRGVYSHPSVCSFTSGNYEYTVILSAVAGGAARDAYRIALQSDQNLATFPQGTHYTKSVRPTTLSAPNIVGTYQYQYGVKYASGLSANSVVLVARAPHGGRYLVQVRVFSDNASKVNITKLAAHVAAQLMIG